MTAPTDAVLDELLAEVRSLKSTVANQQAELEALRDSSPRVEDANVSRRRLFALGAAGVGAATFVGSQGQAAAANGDAVTVGGSFDGTGTTLLENTATGVPIAGDANALRGVTSGADNGAHTILGITAGIGHGIAGVTTNEANTTATTWGRGNHVGAAVEGEQINTSGIPLAGAGNAVAGVIYTGSKGDPQPSDNHSHAIQGTTYGGGHSIAGVTPATAKHHSGTGLNAVATTWGKNFAVGPAVEGEQATTEAVALAGGGNAVKGIIFVGDKNSPSPSDNHSHAVLGSTTGGGHAIAGVTPANAKHHSGTGLNAVATTWGLNFAVGPAVEGEQKTAETVDLAGGGNAVKGIIWSGADKSNPDPSANHSHAVLGVTSGGGHAVAGDIPANAMAHDGNPDGNRVAATWGRHGGVGAGIGGISTGGYGGEFIGGKASVRLIPSATPPATAPMAGAKGELIPGAAGQLFYAVEDDAFVDLAAPAAGGLTMMLASERAYDSRATKAPTGTDAGAKGKLGVGQVRTIDLDAETSLPGMATIAYVNVTVTNTRSSGHLSVVSGDVSDAAIPDTSMINWSASNQTVANSFPVAISAAKTIKVKAANVCDFVVDVLGYA